MSQRDSQAGVRLVRDILPAPDNEQSAHLTAHGRIWAILSVCMLSARN